MVGLSKEFQDVSDVPNKHYRHLLRVISDKKFLMYSLGIINLSGLHNLLLNIPIIQTYHCFLGRLISWGSDKLSQGGDLAKSLSH